MMFYNIYNYISQDRKKKKIYNPLCQTYNPTIHKQSISKYWTNIEEISG